MQLLGAVIIVMVIGIRLLLFTIPASRLVSMQMEIQLLTEVPQVYPTSTSSSAYNNFRIGVVNWAVFRWIN